MFASDLGLVFAHFLWAFRLANHNSIEMHAQLVLVPGFLHLGPTGISGAIVSLYGQSHLLGRDRDGSGSIVHEVTPGSLGCNRSR